MDVRTRHAGDSVTVRTMWPHTADDTTSVDAGQPDVLVTMYRSYNYTWEQNRWANIIVDHRGATHNGPTNVAIEKRMHTYKQC